jgi:hypothetical protein
VGTLNPQDGTPAPSSPLDQLVSPAIVACSVRRAAHSRASGFVLWPVTTVAAGSGSGSAVWGTPLQPQPGNGFDLPAFDPSRELTVHRNSQEKRICTGARRTIVVHRDPPIRPRTTKHRQGMRAAIDRALEAFCPCPLHGHCARSASASVASTLPSSERDGRKRRRQIVKGEGVRRRRGAAILSVSTPTVCSCARPAASA